MYHRHYKSLYMSPALRAARRCCRLPALLKLAGAAGFLRLRIINYIFGPRYIYIMAICGHKYQAMRPCFNSKIEDIQ